MKRKKITVLIIIFICCFSLHALSHKALISMNVTSSFSKINEYVFENKTIESELNWKGFRPGIDVDFEYKINNFGFDLSVYSAIPIMSGSVIDKDYFISGSNMGKITKYSEHKLITDKDYRFTLDLWYYLFLNKIVLSFGLSGGYSNFKFESDDGFFQYPKDDTEPWTGNDEKIFLNEIITF